MKAQIPEKKISKAEPIRPFCLEYTDAKAEVFGSKAAYDSWWFERQATKIGTEYVRNIEKENKE